jgi:hypothetical protein
MARADLLRAPARKDSDEQWKLCNHQQATVFHATFRVESPWGPFRYSPAVLDVRQSAGYPLLQLRSLVWPTPVLRRRGRQAQLSLIRLLLLTPLRGSTLGNNHAAASLPRR